MNSSNELSTVTVRGTGVRIEAIASGTISPGHLLKRTSAAADTVAVHGVAGGKAQRMFAVENDLLGKGMSTDYTDGQRVQANIFQAGDVVNALVKSSVTKGDFLESAGDGALQTYGSDSVIGDDAVIVGVALESVTVSSAAKRCKVEIQ